MNIANISYLNLLPFRVFLKKRPKSFSMTLQITKRGSHPAKINELFLKKRVEAAFVSSVASTRANRTNSGIVAKGAVKSVIVKIGEQKNDDESATSNKLAKILGLNGEVFIGDKALARYLKAPDEYVDLAAKWNETTGLPFVFGRFCFNKKKPFYKKLSNEFCSKKTSIPTYQLNGEATKKGFSPKEAKEYLTLISYRIGYKEERGFALFMKKVKKL